MRKGRPPTVCPTCGAPQEYDDEDPLARRSRVPSHEFHGANLIGVIVGGVVGLILGVPFAAVVYHDKEPLTLLLFLVLYAAGFAFLGCAFGFMAVGFWNRRE